MNKEEFSDKNLRASFILPQSKSEFFFDKIFEMKNESILINIIKYLEYNDLLILKQTNRNFYNRIHNKKLMKLYILNSSINEKNRLIFYESNININKMKEMIIKELYDYKITKNIYKSILNLSENEKEKNPHFKKVLEEISRDINRTFYTDKFTKGNGIAELQNILNALAFIRPEIGYCQGMNFIAGALINFIENEEKCFWIFLSFIDNIELNLLYLKNMPDYSIRVYQLNYYIKQYFPKLASHFKKNQINPEIFFSKWILTIFSNYLPFDVLYNVWDIFILDQWKCIFKFSLILLKIMHDKLIKMDLQEFSQYFKSKNNMSDLSFANLVKFYNSFKITNKKLIELKEDFFVEEVRKKLNDPNSEWETDQDEFVNQYKKELDEHINNINKATNNLQNKIEQLNKDFEHSEKTYDNQLNLVNSLKLKVEVLIEMKTGYENVLSHVKEPINIKGLKKNNSNHNIYYVNNNNNLFNKLNGNDNNNNNNNNNNINNDENNNEKVKKKNKFIKLLKIKKEPKTESEKLQKKLKKTNKEIDNVNKTLFENYKILDKKKYHLEKIKKERDEFKNKLENIFKESENIKKYLLKNLSQKLKLTAKFVATNKY